MNLHEWTYSPTCMDLHECRAQGDPLYQQMGWRHGQTTKEHQGSAKVLIAAVFEEAQAAKRLKSGISIPRVVQVRSAAAAEDNLSDMMPQVANISHSRKINSITPRRYAAGLRVSPLVALARNTSVDEHLTTIAK